MAITGQQLKQSRQGKKRGRIKGRRVDSGAREEVCLAIIDLPRRRDLLIEYLHCLQDRYGHLSAAHLVALADEMGGMITPDSEIADGSQVS